MNLSRKKYAKLKWSGVSGTSVDYYRNMTKYNTPNDGRTDGPLTGGSYTYKVCKLNTTNCSASVTITY